MNISEIREIEENREGQFNVVHLIKEGSFYHANDWSGYLMVKHPIGAAKTNAMKVTAKKLKDDYIHCFVGFPATSLSKYIPNDEIERMIAVNDSMLDVTLKVDYGEATMEDVRGMVDEWKNTLPLSESKKQKREDRAVRTELPRITKISDVFSHILSIPMEDISPRDAYDILRDLRRQVSELF